ncbi:TIGR01244 family sulfur transferase [Oceanisphaera avium]|uniref:TIGR01244 family protein n=1 Tax=Oceanisphaera avium TaxID=1903694 RepID=A0A1Y0CYW6_9GAMM|nr:TIGR01244 family sulfur transferase [Oceanisphaera avium]ART80204.1 TIGR01244 family protein [Oceanisphaera avium]
MEIKSLTPSFSVAGQINNDDLIALKDAGYDTVICNRPNGEASEQPTAQSLNEQARALGLEWHWLPITPGELSQAQVSDFAELLRQAEQQQRKVLAFCRSGMRSISLWALTQAQHTPSSQLIQQAKAAGYDLSGLTSELNRLYQPA